jgi:two-component system, sensor histidine kinase YesM
MKLKFGLAGRQFLVYFIITFALFSLLSWSSFQTGRNILRGQILDEAGLLIEQSNRYLDLYGDNIRNLCLYMKTNQALFTEDIDKARETIYEIRMTNPAVFKTLYVRRPDGEVIASEQAEYDIFSVLSRERFPIFDSQGDGLLWTDRYLSPVSGVTVTFMLHINPGVVAVDVDLDTLFAVLSGLLYSEGRTVVITSQDGNCLMFDPSNPMTPFRPRLYPLTITDRLQRELYAIKDNTGSVAVTGKNTIVLRSDDNVFKWNIHVLIDPKSFNEELDVLLTDYLRIGLLLFIILLVVSFIASYIITNPIRRLSTSMDRVTSLHQMVPIPNTYRHELSELVRSYNALMDRINQLTIEKNDFEWRMLQSQIGPHFLYNTLTCINSLAKRYRTDKVQATIYALVDLLRHSFDHFQEEVPLRETVSILDAYVLIQNTRYDDIIRLEYVIPEELLDIEVPSLLLQPLVENAIFHGIIPTGRPGTVTIRAEKVSKTLRLTVADNGLGMKPEKVEELLDMMKRARGRTDRSKRSSSRDTFTGIGLKNIHDRIKLHYGQSCDFRISSSWGEGTSISLILPLPIGNMS